MAAERNGHGVMLDASIWLAYAFDQARNLLASAIIDRDLLSDELMEAYPDHRVLHGRVDLLERALVDSWTGRALRPVEVTKIDEIARQNFVPQRVIGPAAEIRLVSPGVASDLEQRLAEDGNSPTLFHLLEVADEGLRDFWFRGADPATELRVCAWCDETFIPDRPGRARYCSTRCRMSAHRLRNAIAHGEAVRRREFACRSCSITLSPDNYSGLAGRAYSELETVPRGLIHARDGWCIPCAFEHLPRWKRYLAPFEVPEEGGRRLEALR
jgi:hypothetical protein